MAKKSTKKSNIFKELFGNIADVGVNVIIGNLKTAATDAMDAAQQRMHEAVKNTLKAAAVFVIMIFGIILALVGYAAYLSATVPSLANGLGYVAVGGVLIVLGLLIQFFKN